MKTTCAKSALSLLFVLSSFLSLSVYAGDKPVFDLVIKDHKFYPEVVEIPEGVKVILLVDNQDPTPEEFESHELNREKIIPGNTKAKIFVGPLKSGEYSFFGEFNEATAQGILKVSTPVVPATESAVK